MDRLPAFTHGGSVRDYYDDLHPKKAFAFERCWNWLIRFIPYLQRKSMLQPRQNISMDIRSLIRLALSKSPSKLPDILAPEINRYSQ